MGQPYPRPDGLVAGSGKTRRFPDFDLINRSIFFIITLLIFWVSVHPFSDISIAARPGAGEGDTINEIVFVLLATCCAGFYLTHDVSGVRRVMTPMLMVMAAWLIITVLFSQHPSLSARRLLLQAIVFAIAALMVQLPRTIQHFSALMAGCVLFVLALCYMGVLIAPALSIHQVSDPMETLVGDWRGLFDHKNSAGAMMAMFIVIGLFVARVSGAVLGWSIVVLSAIFLLFSHSKAPIVLLPFVLIISPAILGIQSRVGRIVATLGIVGGFSFLTVGSIIFELARNVLDAVLPDPTFTGRIFIWEFIQDHLPDYLVTGYGFAAFWGSSEIVYGMTDAPEFVPVLASGHNSYLDLAMTLGLPGLALVVAWAVLEPMWDLHQAQRGTKEYLIELLFIRIWLLGITLSCFESMLLERNSPTWFMILLSVFGLHHMSRGGAS